MLQRLGRTVRAAGLAGLDLLLPPHCLTCDGVVDAQDRLCAACFAATGFITEPVCARCGIPFRRGAAGRVCAACRERPPLFERARAPLRYDAQARRLVLPLKYADRPELARALAPHMARAGAALLRQADLLVPVPLHRARLFRRRYNQAALLARALSRLSGVAALPDALVRRRATVSLGDLSAAERVEAVAGAFAVRPHRAARIAGARVLLIDDVLTSGATANACAAVLLAAGAVAVDVLAAARTLLADPA